MASAICRAVRPHQSGKHHRNLAEKPGEQGRLCKGTTVVIIGSLLVGKQIVDAVQMRVV
jgi:hypothetical protein